MSSIPEINLERLDLAQMNLDELMCSPNSTAVSIEEATRERDACLRLIRASSAEGKLSESAEGLSLTEEFVPSGTEKLTYTVLAWLFGWLGLHHLYAHRTSRATWFICISVLGGLLTAGIATLIVAVIAFCEGLTVWNSTTRFIKGK